MAKKRPTKKKAAKRRPAKKKAAAKRKVARKAAKKKAARPRTKAAAVGIDTIPKLTLDMPLDAKKIKAIQKCIEKGHLKLTVKKVNLASGKLGDPWLYD